MPISTGLNSQFIRVGIILPEDNISHIELAWEAGLPVQSNDKDLQDVYKVNIRAESDHLDIQIDKDHQVFESFSISSPDLVDELAVGQGIRIGPVVAGRGFHWEKKLQVILPGILEISAHKGKIFLLNVVNIETYVACVATSEMGAEAPNALLSAQTIVARCWALALAEAKHVAEGFDVCNDDCCQRYQGTTFLTDYSLSAARATKGEVLIYDSAVIDARYSKNCGGMVEAYESVWEGGTVPYLIPLWDGPKQKNGVAADDLAAYMAYDDAYCSSKRFEGINLTGMLGKVDISGSYYRWKYDVPKTTVLKNLVNYEKCHWENITDIKILERGPSTRILALEIEGIDAHGQTDDVVLKGEYRIRQCFSESFLYSSAFEIMNASTLTVDSFIKLHGAGWGHGVGLCQMGALGMALDNIDYPEILKHYYPGTRLVRMGGE